jgi:hypothetical protein
MAIHERVGRHLHQGGKDCRCRKDDQQTVIDLLNRIPFADGGSNGKLVVRKIEDGVCSDVLFGAIRQFEHKNFPQRETGFVEPHGDKIKLMEKLAARPAPKPESPLDILRRNLQSVQSPSADQQIVLLTLIVNALRHIDYLESHNYDRLPFLGEVFGKAYITTSVSVFTMERGPLLRHFASSLTQKDVIETSDAPVLILFQDGHTAVVPAHTEVTVDLLRKRILVLERDKLLQTHTRRP